MVVEATRALGEDERTFDVSTHGTGTALGDPIECESLKNAFARARTPLTLTASKSCVGHAEAAAGSRCREGRVE